MSFIVNGVEIDLAKVAKEAEKNGASKKTSQSSRPVTVVKKFRAQALDITGLQDIEIMTHDDPSIELTLTGSQEAIDALKMSVAAQVLCVSGSVAGQGVTINNFSRSGSIVMMGGHGTVRNVMANNVFNGNFAGGDMVVVSDGDIAITTGGCQTTSLKLQAKVPDSTDLSLEMNNGKLVIGDMQSEVNLEFGGRVEANIGSTTDLNVSASGSCQIMVNTVNGDVDADLSGSSKLSIASGAIAKLDADASGMSSISVYCAAQKAKLDTAGMSKIYLRRCLKRPRQDTSGMSQITVDHIG